MGHAQKEYVSELSASSEEKKHAISLKSLVASSDTLSLPFFDDFSYPRDMLNEAHWEDNSVLVNDSYAKDPVSVGVATFDLLNANRSVYDSAGVFPFIADQLTSKPILLSGKEDVFLSFFYQPMGLGDEPERSDSLMLFFKSMPDETWVHVWSAAGSEIHEFTQVILPVNQERFLFDGFQFRFENKASLTKEPVPGLKTNSDHWNIDYILLDDNRSFEDTTYNDVVFSERVGSVLKKYSAVPWRHFPNARNQELQSRLTLHVKNLNQEVVQVDIRYLFQDMLNPSHQSSYTYNPANLNEHEDTTFIEDIDFDFLSSQSDDSAKFLIKAHLLNIDKNFNNVYNDTVAHEQIFKDYYAYDDGSAEAGYGFRGIGSEVAQLAYYYHVYKPDSLRAIDILFNPTFQDALDNETFRLTIWNVNREEQIPGDIVYERIESVQSGEGFVRYHLDDPIFMNDDYFIGWQQIYSNYLNIGFDRNRNSSANTFINFSGFWQNSGESGTLMIRPVFGKRRVITNKVDQLPSVNQSFSVYPNPASSQVYMLGLDQNHNWDIQLFNLTGKLVMQQPFNGASIPVHHLKEGIYILKISNNRGESMTRKIVISR